MPDVSKWIKSHFYTNSWTFASGIKKFQFSAIYIWPFDFRATLASGLSITMLHQFLTVDPRFVQRGYAGPHQICILPHVWMSDLRDLCRGLPVPKRNSHSTTCLGVWLKRTISADGCCGRSLSPHHMFAHPTRAISQRVAQGQTRPAFRHMFGCPTRRG